MQGEVVESRPSTAAAPQARRAWGAVRQDPLFGIVAAVLLGFLALYLLPIVSHATLANFIATWADPILITLAVLAFQIGKRSLETEERQFWDLMTVAFVLYSGGAWLHMFVEIGPQSDWLLQEGFFLLQFVCTFLAISLNPHVRGSSGSLPSLRFRLESIGTLSFATILACYFGFIPAYYGESGAAALRMMLLAVDPMLAFAFFYAASAASSRRWRAIYRLLGSAWLCWLTADAVENLGAMGIIDVIPYGTVYDFLCWAPFLLAVTAARIGRLDDNALEQPLRAPRASRRVRYLFGPLVVSTTSLPLIHFGLSAVGALQPTTRSAREICVFFGLLLLGSLALLNEKLIDRHRRRTEEENKRLAAFPIKNPNPFLTFSGAGELKYVNPAASRVVQELGLESFEEFLPAKHQELVSDCSMTRSGYRDIEVTVQDRIFSFGYYANSSGDDVFVYVMDITDRKRAEGKLKHDALHDTLTGLPNRSLVMEILSRSIERARRDAKYRFALLFLDLNRFKLVNDSLGHLAGDRFLVEISKRLSNCLRKNDVVGRFGGDEFVVIIDDIKGVATATRAASRIQKELSRPLILDGQEIVTSACIGVAMNDGTRQQPEDYLRDADIAMYRAKAQGDGAFEVFDQRMHDAAVKALSLENSLRHAVERGELVLHYQPYVSLTNGGVVGFEALIRWNHPEMGMVAPLEFIPLAEDVGLIVPIGWWVIEEACRRLEKWVALVGSDAELTVSVNVSTRQLHEHDFVARLQEILDRHDFERTRLCLEITESVVTDLGGRVVGLLRSLKALGVRLAVDDFGTGYSSLSYLREFPIDVLKIDRSFVSSLDGDRQNAAIVRAITTLARDLDLLVIGEGVETRDQANNLRKLGCTIAQGYLFSRPVVQEAAEHMLCQDVLSTDIRRAS